MKNILYLFLAVTMFACSDDDSSDTNDNNATNPSLEKRISQMGIHDIQTCSSRVNGDSIKFTYANNKLSSALVRTYEFNCYENDWGYADYDRWYEVNFEHTENYLIINQVGTIALECPLDNDGNITSIPQRQSDGYLGWDFEYSNGYLTKTTLNEYPNDYDVISTLNWDNDNLISIERDHQSQYHDSSTITFQYSDKLNKSELFVGGEYSLNDVYDILFLDCGRTSKNLPSQAFVQYYNQNGLTSSNKYEYDYILDDDGYVRFLTIARTHISYSDWDDTYSDPVENIWTLEFEYTN
jgi:hypothetical protein